MIRWLDAAEWPARDEVTQLAVRGWLGSLEEVALAATTSPVPRESVVELLVEGLIADLERAGRLQRAPVRRGRTCLTRSTSSGSRCAGCPAGSRGSRPDTGTGPRPRRRSRSGWDLVAADAARAQVVVPTWLESEEPGPFDPEALAGLAPAFGVLLLRRAGYAVAAFEGGTVAEKKVGTRHIHGRTAAGGWSQQRYARRRDNQADEIVGSGC